MASNLKSLFSFSGEPDYIKELRKKKDVDGLINSLSHQDQRVRFFAAKALHEIDDIKAVEPLVPLLQDDDAYVRVCAAVALSKFNKAGDIVHKTYEEILYNPSIPSDLRRIAARALLQIKIIKRKETINYLLFSPTYPLKGENYIAEESGVTLPRIVRNGVTVWSLQTTTDMNIYRQHYGGMLCLTDKRIIFRPYAFYTHAIKKGEELTNALIIPLENIVLVDSNALEVDSFLYIDSNGDEMSVTFTANPAGDSLSKFGSKLPDLIRRQLMEVYPDLITWKELVSRLGGVHTKKDKSDSRSSYVSSVYLALVVIGIIFFVNISIIIFIIYSILILPVATIIAAYFHRNNRVLVIKSME